MLKLFWNLYAIVYGGLYYFRPYIQKLDDVILHLQHNLLNNSYILDLGCGTSTITKRWPDYIKTKWFGVDISEIMIKFARKNCPNGIFVRGNFFEGISHFHDQNISFDRIIIIDSLYTEPNRLQVVNRLHTILNKNGVVIATFPSKDWNIKKLISKNPLNQITSLKAIPSLILVWFFDSILTFLCKRGPYDFMSENDIKRLFSNFNHVKITKTYGDSDYLVIAKY
ncbi:MAG: class I SAM-dependent methyltransferase [bacterium]